ncbi:FAD-binding and (Fe-S)-binding domain-containing protein [Marinirhabdus gelatinilytica]|uniref:FAD/FMN-containing dehydrogenase n=1 Tax=Marinirhabdus gelatinilytica TaxID=1703343 RepID=A0A370Q614_9FLAO|nr:FAD-binding and (Fe-S)-binding domain-containing protein [Marinirhabdus gelatinilytica]RDK83520.1 FAD/FMN-containing dehydrogenase [Marinirhabdus gelatinilytica]
MEEKLQALQTSLLGELHFDTLHTSIYATDASVYRKLPLAVAFPKNEEDIQKLITFVQEHETSLIPRTAGTSLAGQCVGEGIVVDVSKHFTGILSLDTKAKTVTVQPGVIRDELNAYLEPHGLFFGPNTSTSNRCMIGGMVGNNSSGTTSIKYGVTRDKVMSLTALLSNGERVTFAEIPKDDFIEKTKQNTLEGAIYKQLFTDLSNEATRAEIIEQFPKPEIHRRNTGYAVDALLNNEVFSNADEKLNLCKLLCGSEGTLAFTTEITLQLDELPPPETALVVAQYETLEKCLNDINNVTRHDLYTCEMMDDIILDRTKQNKKYEPYRFFVEGSPKALLMLEVRANSPQELNKQTSLLIDALNNSGLSYAQPILKGTEITMAMELRKAGLGLLGNMVGDEKAVACIEDTAVALSDLPAFIKEFAAIMHGYGQQAVYYAHAGAGELHLRPILNLKTEKGKSLFREITTDVAKLTKKYKGSFSGEHGDGIVRAEFLKMQIGTANFGLLKRIKKTFDPNNIFNPGKITDAWPMDKNLRTDTTAEGIVTKFNFADSKGIVRLAEKCNGSGDCRKTEHAQGAMCPSYHATKNEKDTTRARANMLREVLTHNDASNKFNSKELKEVFDLCIGCKACASECPSNVDMATAKAEFLYQYRKANGASTAEKLVAKSSYFNKQASKYPVIANFVFSNPITSGIIKAQGNIAEKRSVPKISSKSFSKYYNNIDKQEVTGSKIVLFVDEFSNYLDAEIAIDTFELLTALGYTVEAVHHLDSARAMLSKGFLDEAKAEAEKNVAYLKTKVSKEVPLVGIEPSAILGFRDEYLRLVDDVKGARHISENTFLIEEFLASEIERGNISANRFTSEEKTVKIHAHCHQKALSNQKVTFDMLNLPENYKPTIITSGCCGMAGSFGYEKEHYEVSMKIGELKLFPSVKKTPKTTIIAANGTSCRHQIKDGTQREALHPVTILRRALKNPLFR